MWTKDANRLHGEITWQQALDYVKGMNAGTYENFGHTDWHLPNVNEQRSLIDFSQYEPSLSAGNPFTNVPTVMPYGYWSSTTYASSPEVALHVDMSFFAVHGDYKSVDYYNCVWPVRGGQVQPTGCSTWTDVISKYNAYVDGQALWNDVIACYQGYASSD
jgi:hypothetical protein